MPYNKISLTLDSAADITQASYIPVPVQLVKVLLEVANIILFLHSAMPWKNSVELNNFVHLIHVLRDFRYGINHVSASSNPAMWTVA